MEYVIIGGALAALLLIIGRRRKPRPDETVITHYTEGYNPQKGKH